MNTLYNYRYLPSCLFVGLIIVGYHVAGYLTHPSGGWRYGTSS
jgi:hypothetical protein